MNTILILINDYQNLIVNLNNASASNFDTKILVNSSVPHTIECKDLELIENLFNFLMLNYYNLNHSLDMWSIKTTYINIEGNSQLLSNIYFIVSNDKINYIDTTFLFNTDNIDLIINGTATLIIEVINVAVGTETYESMLEYWETSA